MKFEFECELCKKQVKRGDKFEVELHQYETDCSLHGVECADDICFSCAGKIERKINSLRK